MFRVGQKVVCVDDSPTDALGGRCLVRGHVYTVRWVGVWGDFETQRQLCLRLIEIERGPDPWIPDVIDVPFLATRFRPIVSRPTSIAVFEEILRNVNAPAEVSA